MDEKELYAEKLARRAERGLLAIKILFFIGIAVAAGLVIFAIIAFTAIEDAQAKIAGFAVFISLIAALLVSVCVSFAVAKSSLIKLNKLG